MSENIEVMAVPPAEVIAKWSEVEPLIEAALPVRLRRFLPIDILAMAIQNQALFWFVRKDGEFLAVAVTRIDIYPRSRSCSIFCLAGVRMAEWFERAEEVLTAYA